MLTELLQVQPQALPNWGRRSLCPCRVARTRSSAGDPAIMRSAGWGRRNHVCSSAGRDVALTFIGSRGARYLLWKAKRSQSSTSSTGPCKLDEWRSVHESKMRTQGKYDENQ